MKLLAIFIFFILGAVVGSFLNVVILRLGTGRGVSGRSACPNCGRKLRWMELIPIASFFLQKGRCRGCSGRISWQYPLVELASATVFSAILLKFWPVSPDFRTLADILLVLISFSLLVVLTVYDFKHKIIPDGAAYGLLAVAFVRLFVIYPPADLFRFPLTLDLTAGVVLASPFFLIWLVSGGRWMGLGDAKLALGLGALGGISSVPAVFVCSFWLGAFWSLSAMILGRIFPRLESFRKLGMKSEVPFAPFMVIASAVIFFLGAGPLDVSGFLAN